MDPEETVEVTPSEDNGNVAIDAPESTPSAEQTTTDTPAEKTEVTPEPVTPEVELFELPDGRKVDAVTLTKEWKENFLPDYTQKSQQLAALEKPLEKPQTVTDKYADPEYVPTSYAEILEEATQRAISTIKGEQQKETEKQQAIENAVETQLTEIRKTDPDLNENALFQHATKYGFRDLKAAHLNMRDMSAVVKKTQDTTVKNIAKRNDPVSSTPGATGARPDPSNFANARDYLKSLQQ